MAIGGERTSVQNPFINYAVESGWTYLSPEEALNYRRGITSPVLDSVLVERLIQLNPGFFDRSRAEETVHRIVRVKPNIEGNLDAWEYIKGLKTIFVPEEKRERNITLIDPHNIEANAFHVTDELTFSNGTPPDVRTDITFFINGIPVLIVEAKAATKLEGIAEAFEDMRYYHDKGPELLALAQLFVITHAVRFYYGATWSLSRKLLFNWRDEQAAIDPSRGEVDFETLCKTFIAPRRIVRILHDFILFVRSDDELKKAVLRPHQMRAVERCVQRARNEEKRRGLVWHTQGSGKTYTMITVAKRLIEDERFDHPTVVMLIDRNELEQQLFGELESVGFKNIEVADTKKHLRELLKNDRRGLIVTMIHKFDGMRQNIITRNNVYVLVDEAHRTTGGDLGNYLMGALPNATYIGFTGTPIDKTQYGKGTFKTFGTDDEKGYLDKYSIRESVEDGTTVPLHYSLAPNELRVDRETLEKEFFSLAELEGVSDIDELNKVLEKAVTLRNMLKNKDRVDRVAKFVAAHFKETVEPMGYKAFLVTVDREACALYKEALDRYLDPEYSRVVISSGGKKDSKLLRKYHLSADEEKKVRKAFRKPDEEPKILIITEKLLTGFDAPILYCMYLDKPMRDHVLLQAIARVNRPYEEEGRRKTSGFVLDFVGIFDKLERALAFDSEDVKGVVEGIEILRHRFESLMEEARNEYLKIHAGLEGDKADEAILEYFRDEERREEFYAFFRELQDIYEILSPDPFLRPFLKDYGSLVKMYHLVKANYERGISVDREFQRKTEKLVQEHTVTGQIKEPSKEYKLDVQTLEQIAASGKPDTVKVFNLLKIIHDFIKQNANREPYLINIGDRAEEIARAFEQRQKTTKETLESLDELIREMREAQDTRKENKLSAESFAVYWYLKNKKIEQAHDIAEKVEKTFEEHPHWQMSSHQEQEVRKNLYKSLIDSGISEGVVELGKSILKLLRRASG